MDELEILQPNNETGRIETNESADAQSLDEATHEPCTHVERTQDFKQAEAIESMLTETMRNAETTAAAQPQIAGTPEAPESQALDPLTGKGYSGQSQSSDNDSGEEGPQIDPSSDRGNNTPGEAISGFQPVGQEPGGTEGDPGQIDGNEPVYEMGHQDSDAGQDIGKGASPVNKQVGRLDPQRLKPENMPEEKQIPFGKGKDGLLVPGGGKGLPGSGGVPGGKGTSGGGLPVRGSGGGAVGKGKEGHGYHSGKGDVGRWLELKAMRDGTPGYVPEPDGKGTWVQDKDGNWHYQETDSENAPAETPPQGDPMDGDQPMPYTGGSTGGGGDPDPKEPLGGPDREGGHFVPVVPSGGGGKDSGGKTPGDKDGEDDSGRFLGDPNLSGSDDYVPPPDDDIPYHNLNKAKKDL